MKESRIIIIISIIMMIALIPFFYILKLCGINSDLAINIITNLGCGIIVGLVTAICQYCIARRRIVNTVYGLYFELYTTYYYVKNKEVELMSEDHEVVGMLLYARNTDNHLPANDYMMSGNKISVRTLDLNCEFSEIKNQLDNIYNSFFVDS